MHSSVKDKGVGHHRFHGNSPHQPQLPGHSEITAKDVARSSDTNADVSDPLNTVPSADEDTLYLFGGSSSIAFVRSLRQSLIQDNVRVQPPTLEHEENGGTVSRSRTIQILQAMDSEDIRSFALPTRRAADSYIQCFWHYMHPVFPMPHKPTFMATYELLWASESEKNPSPRSSPFEDQIYLATLNIIFAIGCQFSENIPVDRRSQVGDQFYQHSRKLVAVDALDSITISVVHLLLPTGVYLQSTKYANRCWSIVGLAIRNAQSLGLHVESSGKSSLNQIKRETRRRLWICA